MGGVLRAMAADIHRYFAAQTVRPGAATTVSVAAEERIRRSAALSRLTYEPPGAGVPDELRPYVPPGVAPIFLPGDRNALADAEVYVWNGPDGEVVTAFRGTDGKRDAVADADERMTRWGSGAGVHRGFHRQFASVRDDLGRTLARCVGGAPKRLVFTGHSLGGALATIAGAYFGGEPWARGSTVEVHTFGAPRCGDDAFARDFAAAVHVSVRVFDVGDTVTMLPFTEPYRHVTGGMRLPDFAAVEDAPPPPRGAWWFSVVRLMAVTWTPLRYADPAGRHGCDRYRRAFDRTPP